MKRARATEPETPRERRLRIRRAIREAERHPVRCPVCGLLEPHVCLAQAQIANSNPARPEREHR